jgi:succinate dehydrogenase flavin-adding protein (antitoxin of CptAB toxin-antitoxin module)
MIKLHYQTAEELGHHPVPLVWNTQTNAPMAHVQGWEAMQPYPITNEHNAMAVRTCEAFTFIDVDTKNSSTLSASDLRTYILIMLQEKLSEDIYKKLFIEQSRNGGLHIFLKMQAPEQKLPIATNSKGNELIALYPKNKLCYTHPTPGCQIIYGERDEMEDITQSELEQIIDLLKALDEPKESKIIEATPKQNFNRPDKWKFFDRKIPSEYFAELLHEIGLSPCRLQPRFGKDSIIYEAWRRTESTAQTMSAKVFFGSEPKVLLFTSSLPQFPSYQSHSRKADWTLTASKLIYYKNGQDAERTENEINEIADRYQINLSFIVTRSGSLINEGTFWKIHEKTGTVILLEDAMLEVITNCGFRRYKEDFIRIDDNIVTICQIGDIIRTLTDIVTKVDKEIYNPVSKRLKSILNNSTILDDLLEWDAGNLLKDDINTVWRYFKNCAVKITKEGAEIVNYYELPKQIWKSDIIERNFQMNDFAGCDSEEFIKLLAGENITELKAMIGYNLTRYNNPAKPEMTLFLENIDEDQEGSSVGGSGKSLIAQMIKNASGNMVFINGRDPRSIFSDFAWSRINHDTRTVFIDDAYKGFKVDALYTVASGDMIINKKNKPEFTIENQNRPKIIITSNYAMGNGDESDTRRLWTFAIEKYFNLSRTPLDHFGRKFFEDWDAEEWLKFDNWATDCIKTFMAFKRSAKVTNIDLKRRMLINSTDRGFVEYMDNLFEQKFYSWFPQVLKTQRREENGILQVQAVDFSRWYGNRNKNEYAAKIAKSELLDTVNSLLKNKLSQTMLTQWLQKWADTKDGLVINSKYRMANNNGLFYQILDLPEVLDENVPF